MSLAVQKADLKVGLYGQMKKGPALPLLVCEQEDSCHARTSFDPAKTATTT
jgi:hypothetical protein